MMETKMVARKARAKALKKAAKEAKRKHENAETDCSGSNKVSKVDTSTTKDTGSVKSSSDLNGSCNDSKHKTEGVSKPIQSIKILNNQSKKDKSKSSVQNDASKSEVYKSLFSSHQSAQNKKTGHWITFDPRYN